MEPTPENILKAANLPDNPGVYFFKDAHGKILYIGRATSLRFATACEAILATIFSIPAVSSSSTW
jgi:hypothetical protein